MNKEMKQNTVKLDEIANVDWSDSAQVHDAFKPALMQLYEDSSLLGAMVESIQESPHLVGLCEFGALIHRLIPYDNPRNQIRLRLHFAVPQAPERPHNHRFPFTVLVLRGGYRHTIYDVKGNLNDRFQRSYLSKSQVRDESAGSCYTLMPDGVHTIDPEPGTVTLFLRGPARDKQSLIYDEASEEVMWQRSASESAEIAAKSKWMSMDDIIDMTNKLKSLNVIP